MKFTHKLTIAGEELTLTSGDKPEYVEKLAAELSKRINTMVLSGAGVTKLDAAIVCALDLLDENCKLKSFASGEKHD